mgnify:CR=1 FL=1
MSMEEQLNCFYLDGNQSASNMLRKCVNDLSSPYEFNCGDNPMKQEGPNDMKNTARMNDIMIQRGITDYYISDYNSSVVKKPVSKNNLNLTLGGMEGFTNPNTFLVDNGPGKSSVPEGECPEGFSLNNLGQCIQKCQGCIYRDNMKSLQFNEKDPCFPDGVYNGITNEGYIKCTCGTNNQYCSDNFIKNLFTTDGILMMEQKIIMNMGNTNTVDDLFSYDTL